MRKEVEIIAHPDVWADKYAHLGNGYRFTNIPFQRQELEKLGANFNLTPEPTRITDSIMTTGEVPMVTDFEKLEPDLYFVRTASGFQLDVQRLGLCHCTGLPATAIIAQAFGNKFFFNNAGTTINLA